MKFSIFSALALLLFGQSVLAGDMPVFELTIQDHRFQPTEITVPTGTKIKLLVTNLDSSPEEFESYELNREKIVPAGKQAVIYIGPLDAGNYPFFGEFHEDTARGTLVAK